MKSILLQKKDPEIKPIPDLPPIVPIPEINPPGKENPYIPSPEIIPVPRTVQISNPKISLSLSPSLESSGLKLQTRTEKVPGPRIEPDRVEPEEE